MIFDVKFKRLPHANGLPLPEYKSEYAVGIDMCAAIPNTWAIMPRETVMVPTGFCFEVPAWIYGELHLRSSVGRKGITMPNGPGLIDPDYRGEIMALLTNIGNGVVTINRGDRIVQLVLVPLYRPATVSEVEALSETVRGAGGFGSTGI